MVFLCLKFHLVKSNTSFYLCLMSNSQRQRGILKNKLLRYKDILDLYNEKKTEDIPTTVVWRKWIYPTFHISRTTLYTILETPVQRDLNKIKEQEDKPLKLF